MVKGKLNNNVTALIIAGFGTLISGSIFITIISIIGGIPEGGLISLLILVVLPEMLVNSIIMLIVYPIVRRVIKREDVAFAQ